MTGLVSDRQMARIKVANAMVALFISMPIWFFLLYRILQAVDATELMWFLYWVYVPVTIVATTVIKLLGAED